MKIRQFANLPNIKALNIVAVSSLAIGIAATMSAAPAQAVVITSPSTLTFSDGATNSAATPITGVAGNFFTVDFNRGGKVVTTVADGSFSSLIPGVTTVNSVSSNVSPSTGNFSYVAGAPVGFFDYALINPAGLDFNFGPTVGNLNIAANSIFRGSFVGANNANFSLNPLNLAAFTSTPNVTLLNVQNFDFSVSRSTDATGSFGLTVAAQPAAVPEPFTIIGSIIGGTAAFRMRKKLASKN